MHTLEQLKQAASKTAQTLPIQWENLDQADNRKVYDELMPRVLAQISLMIEAHEAFTRMAQALLEPNPVPGLGDPRDEFAVALIKMAEEATGSTFEEAAADLEEELYTCLTLQEVHARVLEVDALTK